MFTRLTKDAVGVAFETWFASAMPTKHLRGNCKDGYKPYSTHLLWLAFENGARSVEGLHWNREMTSGRIPHGIFEDCKGGNSE